jgi:hypothetical protein
VDEVKRYEALMAVLTLATNDREFLRGMRTEPEATLWRYGIVLSPSEMALVRGQLEERSDLRDEEFLRQVSRQVTAMRW